MYIYIYSRCVQVMYISGLHSRLAFKAWLQKLWPFKAGCDSNFVKITHPRVENGTNWVRKTSAIDSAQVSKNGVPSGKLT